MIDHKPTPKTDVRIGKELYKCNRLGIVKLPKAYKQFNPIEKPKEKPIKKIEE
jgi:hypothetical protein